MDIDVKTITPTFCREHCPFYDSNYVPGVSDYESLYVDGCCLFAEFQISCLLLDMDYSVAFDFKDKCDV